MTSEPPWWTYFDASWDEMKAIKASFDELYRDYCPADQETTEES
jgi:hypothetical protein